MGLNTDLALEAFRDASAAGKLEGAASRERYDERSELKITEVEIKTREAAEKLGKPIGRYITLESESNFSEYTPKFSERIEVIAKELEKVCASKGRVLFVGLGNRDITADCIGPFTADGVFATRHIKRLAAELDTSGLADTAVIAAGVMAQTGLESAQLVQAVCREIRPLQVVVCDALACLDPQHMGRSIQLSSTGISPGSGVENSRQELSRYTLKVPTAAIGIPTVSRIMSENGQKDLLVTPKSADRLVRRSGEMISAAVNMWLHPGLSTEDILSLK